MTEIEVANRDVFESPVHPDSFRQIRYTRTCHRQPPSKSSEQMPGERDLPSPWFAPWIDRNQEGRQRRAGVCAAKLALTCHTTDMRALCEMLAAWTPPARY